jgi:hypothetical protein
VQYLLQKDPLDLAPFEREKLYFFAMKAAHRRYQGLGEVSSGQLKDCSIRMVAVLSTASCSPEIEKRHPAAMHEKKQRSLCARTSVRP